MRDMTMTLPLSTLPRAESNKEITTYFSSLIVLLQAQQVVDLKESQYLDGNCSQYLNMSPESKRTTIESNSS